MLCAEDALEQMLIDLDQLFMLGAPQADADQIRRGGNGKLTAIGGRGIARNGPWLHPDVEYLDLRVDIEAVLDGTQPRLLILAALRLRQPPVS